METNINIGVVPTFYDAQGGGHFASSEGGLVFLNMVMNGSKSGFSNKYMTVQDAQKKRIGENLLVSQVGWKSDSGILTLVGTLDWHGTTTAITITVEQKPGDNDDVLTAVIGSATLSNRKDGFMSLLIVP